MSAEKGGVCLSFSNDVKNELSRIETNDATGDKAELLGLLRMSGAIVIRGMNIGIHFSTENAALARRVLQLLKKQLSGADGGSYYPFTPFEEE